MSVLKQLNERPIAYYPIYRKITGSTTAGILLSQLMYWFSKKDKIYKIDADIMHETLLTVKELRNAKAKIKELEFIKVTREGLPCKTYYSIDWDVYETILTQWSETSSDHKGYPVSPNGQDCDRPMGESSTETTTKITTESKKATPPKKSKTPPVDFSIFPKEFSDTVIDFIAMRKELKKPMTENAVKLLLKKLESLAPNNFDTQIEIMEQSILNSWQGVFALKIDNAGKNKNVVPFGSQTIHKKDLDERMEDW